MSQTLDVCLLTKFKKTQKKTKYTCTTINNGIVPHLNSDYPDSDLKLNVQQKVASLVGFYIAVFDQ
jgi:hypothetical protein